jgi:TPR repeat protein
VTPNDVFDWHCFKLSAQLGYSESQYAYGISLLLGDGVPMNESLAVHYLQLSADQGNAEGQCVYGLCLLNGVGNGDMDFRGCWAIVFR